MNITNRNENLQIEKLILQIDRMNQQIEWPNLQIVMEIRQIEQSRTAGTARF
ncbi:MAG: hypothetical protein ACQEW2_14005 [Bacillota bacterium]|uniref:hypothetical protein n=1 Tax=Cytobacillus firmus TaxID=1399 RepID=UPI0018CDEA2C|nr:hypothetical protein [Cytobacillus firmus]MED1940458.1 hypothetical protein [Cytobacillus firmus]